MSRTSGAEMVVTIALMLAMFAGIAWYSGYRNAEDKREI